MSSNSLIRRAWNAVRPRMEPKLIILGAQKAGTTTVFDILARHPKVLPPVRKELHFFDTEESYMKGMGYYRSHFPPIPIKARGYVTLEASPRYLFFSSICAPRIARHLPDAYCLILLRDPVQRAYSAWNMNRTAVKSSNSLAVPEIRSFEQAVDDELNNVTTEEQHMYLARSSYSSQILEYKNHINPRQLIISSFIELKFNPSTLINELCNCLSIPSIKKDDPCFKMRSNSRSYRTPIDKVLKKQLYDHFKPEMENLAAVLGRDPNILEE